MWKQLDCIAQTFQDSFRKATCFSHADAIRWSFLISMCPRYWPIWPYETLWIRSSSQGKPSERHLRPSRQLFWQNNGRHIRDRGDGAAAPHAAECSWKVMTLQILSCEERSSEAWLTVHINLELQIYIVVTAITKHEKWNLLCDGSCWEVL